MPFDPLSFTLTGLWVLLVGGVLLAYSLSRTALPVAHDEAPKPSSKIPADGARRSAGPSDDVERGAKLLEAKKERVLLEAKFARAQQDLEDMAKDKAALKDAMEDAQAEAERMNIINRYLHAQLKALQSSRKLSQFELAAIKAALDRSELARAQLQVHAQAIEAQLDIAEESLQTRTDELEKAGVLLRTQDLFADGTEDRLNAAVAQVADSLAQAIEKEVESTDVDTDDTRDAAEAFRRWFSSPTLDDLRSVSSADPTLLSTVFRACLGHMAAFIITRTPQKSVDDLVPTSTTDKPLEEMAGAYVDDLIDMLACVVLAAGIDGDRGRVRAIVRDHAYDGVREVVQAALRIHTAVGDAVATGFVSPLLARVGAASDGKGVRGLMDGLEGGLFGKEAGLKSTAALQLL
ncbi:hypothetical protein OF83DRAFT_1117645 [Amylostereum chailletii]|nr:hypothetical protein OF83DRAFT_1117645 [Amylostereum chailletii]